jgi:hypothetical protein
MHNSHLVHTPFGLLRYEESYNLGDEIQSIAARQFLPQVDFLVDRNTGQHVPFSESYMETTFNKIKTIYNGWFDGQYCHWPPPANIEPLFVSFHINETDHSTDSLYTFLDHKKIPFKSITSYVDYLKSYEPIGCRDLHTLDLLTKNGISAYFSGCMTLTLSNPFHTRNEEILVIDSHILCKNLYEKIIPEHIRKRAIHLSQAVEKPLSHNEKMDLAQGLLDRIAQAKLVITSRLHTALPCLAFRTPVIFLHDNLNDVRFSGLLKYLKAYTHGDQLDVDPDNYQNQYGDEFYEMVSQLTKSVKKWVNSDPLINPGLPGESIFTVCMDRNTHLEKALPTWLATNPNEIIIIDWGSKIPIKPLIEKHNHSRKIKLITINNVDQWILTKSFNLAAKMTKYSNLLKVDCDSLLKPDFFSYHNLNKDHLFFAGNWKLSRNENEKHTNGIVYMKRSDFFQVGGYNEFITTYGYDDCDLYKRLEKRAKRLLINLDSVTHLEHHDSLRIENQSVKKSNRIDVEIERNCMISDLNIWHGMYSYFNVKKISDVEYTGEYLYGVELHEKIRGNLWEKAHKNREYVRKLHPEKKKLYINTKNGLGNRLRALVSAYNIAKATDRQLIVVWIPDSHCEAKFTDLFRINYLFKDVEFIENPHHLRHGDIVEYQCAEYEDLCHNRMIYNYDIGKDKYIDDTTPHDIYVISACVLNNKHTNWIKESFVLKHIEVTDEIGEKIYQFESKHKIQDAIGVHIRMGQPPEKYPYDDTSGYNDHAKQAVIKWRTHSHWSNFIKEMDQIIKNHPETVFFLCCDNEETYTELLKLNQYKIIHTEKHVYDRSVNQVKTAIIDLILLSKTKYMLGSNWSSFTEIAHRLSGKPLKMAGVDF